MNLSYANEIYSMPQNLIIQQHSIVNQDIKKYTIDLRNLERQLGENKDDEYWQSKLRLLKRYRFWLHSVPMGFDNSIGEYFEQIQFLFEDVDKCASIYPQYVDNYQSLLDQATILTQLTDKPLLDKIKALEPPRDSAILIKETRYIAELERALSSDLDLRHVEAVNASQLRYERTFSEIYIVGSMYWFPDFVITAPRANIFHLVYYDFLNVNWKPRVALFPQVELPAEKLVIKQSTPLETEVISAEEIRPIVEIDSDVLVSKYQYHSNSSDEFVDARLVILEDNNAVFLEIDSKELIIDDQFIVHRKKVKEIEPDMFLIAREKGSGDYIVPFANKILGDRAESVREMQRTWKTKLRRAVEIYGVERVKENLKLRGAISANKTNIRNWMSRSERKIRPQKYEDFKAIMYLIDLNDEAKDLWENAGTIKEAHLRAGKVATKLLTERVQESNRELLWQRGYQLFSLEEYETSFHVFRILDIKGEKVRIPLSKAGEVLEI